MSVADVEYLCVGVCLNDPDSGVCLGCGRPPLSPPGPAPQFVAADSSRYPVASELFLELTIDPRIAQ